MRTAFVKELCELAQKDERIWLLCGDLGYSVLEEFITRFPERFVNVGVAEQNMMGVAAGLSMTGKIVFVYSIVNFPIMRCFEQIRNDICYHNQNVKIVAVGGGLTYGSLGYSHHGVEDLAVLRVLPNMTVIAPGDPVETKLATQLIASSPGPCYLRLGKAGEPVVHPSEQNINISQAINLRSGNDIILISIGGMLDATIRASDKLFQLGYSTGVISMPMLAPLDTAAIIKAVFQTHRILTVEEHGVGGLGTAVAEVIAELGEPLKFYPLRLDKEPIKFAGSQMYLRSSKGLCEDGIVAAALKILQ
jgi:transketolase